MVAAGGWYLGDKREIKTGAISFQQQGLAFISINYRLTRTLQHNIHFAQIKDIEKAINTVVAKSKKWNISATHLVFFVGGSAGSHLSLLHACKYNNSKKIKAVRFTPEPNDLTDTAFINNSIGGQPVKDMLTDYVGYSIMANPQAWHDASLVNYISPASDPYMFMPYSRCYSNFPAVGSSL